LIFYLEESTGGVSLIIGFPLLADEFGIKSYLTNKRTKSEKMKGGYDG
jgi:hypothetical protein